MRKLDLRQVGTILGLPLYVDLSSVPLQDQRDKKETLIGEILFKLIRGTVATPKDKGMPAKVMSQLPGQTDIMETLENGK